jgi:hypothetical protein
MPDFKRTEDLTLRLLKGQTQYKYQRPYTIIDEERFFNLVCRKTHDSKGNPVPLLDKGGKPVYYQLQYFLDSDSDVINEEQKQILLQDPSYRDPATGEIKTFPYKNLLGVQRILTEVDGKEWLASRWMWEGLRKDKGVETKSFKKGTYDHPTPTNQLRPIKPDEKDSPLQTVVTAINYKQMYDTPFTKENWDNILGERSAPKDPKHINMTLVKIGPNGTRVGSPYQVTNQEQFLERPFGELFDYLSSAEAKKTQETRIGKEVDRMKNKHYG